MNWAARNNQIGLRKELACVSLLLLMLSQLETPCYALGYGKFSGFKGKLASEHRPGKSNSVFKGNAEDKVGNEFFYAEKRKVYTGPNPLHNR